MLSDNWACTPDPIGGWFNRQLLVPSQACGRLVEEPADIQLALDNFVAFDGLLDPQTAVVADYDFMVDLGDANEQQFEAILGNPAAVNRISETGNPVPYSSPWNRNDLAALIDTIPDLGVIQAHFNHHQALPAASLGAAGNPSEFQYDTGLDLYNVAELSGPGARFTGSAFASIGCNAGVSVSDVVIAASLIAQGSPGKYEAGDFAQGFASEGAFGTVLGTGYGYGHPNVIAVSELMNLLFVEHLDGSVSMV